MLLDKVKNTIEEHNFLTGGKRLVVAVSGGIDSVCLLHALLKLRHFFHFELFVAHFNHRMRTESAADEKFVKKLGLHLLINSINI